MERGRPAIFSARGRFGGSLAAALLAGLVVLAGCGAATHDATGPHASLTPGQTPTTRDTPSTPSVPTPTTPTPERPITIAFAGDVHFYGSLASRLNDPQTAVGPMASVLKGADLSIVNLESAVTTRGTPQPKQYVFRAPPIAFDALKDAGIDVVTMANNHGLDYGPVSVPDALAAAKAANMPLIGIGENATQAYAPWITTVAGHRVAFLAATAVIDSDLISSWSATATQPGLATALDGDNARLVAAVRAVRPHVDTVVVDLHYGSDLETCPTEIQRVLVQDLERAGADIVVGQHAHVLLGAGYAGSMYVDYGMGNFEFYAGEGPSLQTGVLVLTVGQRRVIGSRWVPGEIRGGVPERLTGAAAEAATQQWTALRSCTGLTTSPSS